MCSTVMEKENRRQTTLFINIIDPKNNMKILALIMKPEPSAELRGENGSRAGPEV